MSDNLKFGIAFLIGFLLAVFLFVKLCIKGRTNGNKLKEKAEREGTITTAKAIKHLHRRDDGSGQYQSETVVYEYIVEGHTYRKKLVFRDVGRVDYATEITIYYNKSNPKNSIAFNEINGGQEFQSGCLTSIVVPIIVIAVVYWLLRII